MLIVYAIMAIVIVLISYSWVSYITDTHTKYPDYKGDFRGFDFDDFKENEIHFEDVFNAEKKESLKKFISEHKNIKND